MPTATYGQLLTETLPARIENDDDYEAIGNRFGDLLVKHNRTAAEEKLYWLLRLLIEDYDRRHAMPSDESKPHELLQFLVEQSGKKAGELLKPVFGQRSHVNEAINGKRPISAEQARKLGKLFSVKPGLFI